MEKFHDECGVVGISLKNSKEASALAYLALTGLQHRGQESAGIAVCNDNTITSYKDTGLVTEALGERILSILKGELAIGHVKYSNEKDKFYMPNQPYQINYKQKQLAISFNGGLINANELREKLEDEGVVFSSNSFSELVCVMIARNDKGDLIEAIKETIKHLKGGYTFCLLTEDKIIGVRDPLGIRPMVYGKLEDGYVIASETCAIDMLDGEFIRDINPGEILILENNIVKSIKTVEDNAETANCIFEYVYFSRPDSNVDGINVYESRIQAGIILAKEHPVDGDIVIGVPDSGTPAAIGFSQGSNIPFSAGLIKNKYAGRTFIQPDAKKRKLSVKLKLNPVSSIIKGRKIVLVDDSIVRGTTMKILISNLKNSGAKEVHLRISSPPVYHSCFFGVDTPDEKDLMASSLSLDEMGKALGADSLGFISIDGLVSSVDGKKEHLCTACFSGDYPINIEGV